MDDEGLGGADDPVISEQSRKDRRILITLDLGFSDIRSYPPSGHPGIIGHSIQGTGKGTLLSILLRVIVVLQARLPEGQLMDGGKETESRFRGD